MEPVIRNFRNVFNVNGPTRLIWLADNPPTCTLNYSQIQPGKLSTPHTHPWEHEVFVMYGNGTLVVEGVRYPVKPGDAILVPPGVDHYTVNDGDKGVIRRIEANPVVAARDPSAATKKSRESVDGAARPVSEHQKPLIRNCRESRTATAGRRLIASKDGAPNFEMLFDELAPGRSTQAHSHPWEHLSYMLEGHCGLFCGGKEYLVSEGDGILLPANVEHQWRNPSALPVSRLTFDPVVPEGPGG